MMETQRRSPEAAGGRTAAQPDLGTYMFGLSNAVYNGIAGEVAPYDLFPLDAYLLMICKERGECSATQVTQLLPVDASRVSRLVTGLADKGLVRRRRLRNDRRIVMLRLSPEGERVTAEVSALMQAYYDRLTDGLSPREVDAFAAAALRILANYDAMTNG